MIFLTTPLFRSRAAFSTKDVIAEFGCCNTNTYYAPLSVHNNGVSILHCRVILTWVRTQILRAEIKQRQCIKCRA